MSLKNIPYQPSPSLNKLLLDSYWNWIREKPNLLYLGARHYFKDYLNHITAYFHSVILSPFAKSLHKIINIFVNLAL